MKNRNPTDWPKLMPELEPWLDRAFGELPVHLQERLVKSCFAPTTDDKRSASSWWDELSPQQRRWRAEWRDCQNDPALEASRVSVWHLVNEHGNTRREIEEWAATATPTARDLDIKKTNLAALRDRFAKLDSDLRNMRGDYLDESTARNAPSAKPRGKSGRPVVVPNPDLLELKSRMDIAASANGGTPNIAATCAQFVVDKGGESKTGYSGATLANVWKKRGKNVSA